MIWEKWEKHYKAIDVNFNEICKDGIFNEDEWEKAHQKILFIMKEVNGWKEKERDLKSLFEYGPRYQMWHTVSRWAAGRLDDFPEYEKIDTWDVMKKTIKKIASINLKKTSGKASSDMRVINAYAFRDKELLREQIEQIKPDIVVACGTFDSVIWLLELEVNPDKPYEKPVYDKKRKFWIIPWVHPGRVNNEETYNELKKMFANIPDNSKSPT